jgi:hypothetical protein
MMILLLCLFSAFYSQSLYLRSGRGSSVTVDDAFSVTIENNNIGLSLTQTIQISDVMHESNGTNYNFLLFKAFDFAELSLGRDGCSYVSDILSFNYNQNTYEQICFGKSHMLQHPSKSNLGGWGPCCNVWDATCCAWCNGANTRYGKQNVVMKYPGVAFGGPYSVAKVACQALSGTISSSCVNGNQC